jgi:hypothetical protein
LPSESQRRNNPDRATAGDDDRCDRLHGRRRDNLLLLKFDI